MLNQVQTDYSPIPVIEITSTHLRPVQPNEIIAPVVEPVKEEPQRPGILVSRRRRRARLAGRH